VTYEVHPEVHYGRVVKVECDHGVIHEVAYGVHHEVHHVQVVKIICKEGGRRQGAGMTPAAVLRDGLGF
jgi:hypothetical protein